MQKAADEGGAGLTLDEIRGFERLASAHRRLHESIPVTRAEFRQGWLRENVLPGRVISQGRSGKRIYFVISVHGEKISAMRDDGQGASVSFDRVTRIYKNVYLIKEANIEQAFFDTFEGKNKPLDEPKPDRSDEGTTPAEEKLAAAMDAVISGTSPADAKRRDERQAFRGASRTTQPPSKRPNAISTITTARSGRLSSKGQSSGPLRIY